MKKRLLFFLDADKKWVRILRRGVVIFLLAGVVAVGNDVLANNGQYISASWMPIFVGILATLDKLLRELKE